MIINIFGRIRGSQDNRNKLIYISLFLLSKFELVAPEKHEFKVVSSIGEILREGKYTLGCTIIPWD